MLRFFFTQGILESRNFLALVRDTLVGTVTLIVGPGLIVIDRCLALGEVEKRTGPRDGMWRMVGVFIGNVKATGFRTILPKNHTKSHVKSATYPC